MQINSLEGELVEPHHITVYSSHFMTTEIEKYINEISFIENLSVLKYSIGAQSRREHYKKI